MTPAQAAAKETKALAFADFANNIRARLISRLYFPNREISLALILFVLQFTAD